MANGKTSAEKTLALLDLFGGTFPNVRGLTELARASGQNKATCYRGLQTLCRMGLLARNGDQYHLGYKIVELANRLKDSIPLHRVALPYMERLRDVTKQSVQLVVRDGDSAVYLEVVPATQPVRLYIQPGRRAPLFAGASTRLLLAYTSSEKREAILNAFPPQHYTEQTILDPAELEQRLIETRETGFAISFGELESGSAETAAPIIGAEGHVLAAISIAGFTDPFLNGDQRKIMMTELDKIAQKISRRMGFEGKWASDLGCFLKNVATRFEGRRR